MRKLFDWYCDLAAQAEFEDQYFRLRRVEDGLVAEDNFNIDGIWEVASQLRWRDGPLFELSSFPETTGREAIREFDFYYGVGVLQTKLEDL